MRNVFRGLAAITMSLAVYAGTADAQMASPIQFGFGGGITIPQVKAFNADVWDNGFHFLGVIAWSPAPLPVGLRGEIMYHSMNANSDFASDGKGTVLGGGVNAMWKLPLAESVLRPYLTGGIGVYKVEGEAEGETSKETKFGANGGGGLQFDLAGFSAFLEARYLRIFTDFEEDIGEKVDVGLIPITFGIMFGGR